MNLAKVIMCWNIPRIPEDLIHELFCIAGPIEDISFGKNGKTCFIVFEQEDAIGTAKELFEGIRLNGQPLRMFDYKEILKIYENQEELVARNAHFDLDAEPNAHNFGGGRPYDGRNYVRHHFDGRPPPHSPGFGRDSFDYRRGNARYSSPNGRGAMAGNLVRLTPQKPEESRFNDGRRTSSMASGGGSGGYQSRADLLPAAASRSPRNRRADDSCAPNFADDPLRALFATLSSNPYAQPVSRNPRDGRSRSRDAHRYRGLDDVPPGIAPDEFGRENGDSPASSSSSLRNERRNFGNRSSSAFEDCRPYAHDSRRSASDNFDPLRALRGLISHGDGGREPSRNELDGHHSRHYRDRSPPARHHSHHARGPKFHDLPPPEADYMSRSQHHSQRGRRYQGQHNDNSSNNNDYNHYNRPRKR